MHAGITMQQLMYIVIKSVQKSVVSEISELC
jgi:hypothetical protein